MQRNRNDYVCAQLFAFARDYIPQLCREPRCQRLHPFELEQQNRLDYCAIVKCKTSCPVKSVGPVLAGWAQSSLVALPPEDRQRHPTYITYLFRDRFERRQTIVTHRDAA